MDRVRYAPPSDLGRALRAATTNALACSNGVGDRRLWARAGSKTAWFFGTYAVLVFVQLPWWAAATGAVSLGLAASATAPTVHDAGHREFSRHPWVNRLIALASLPTGISPSWWAVKHNAEHHGYTNVKDRDNDLEFGRIARFSSAHAWRPWHRWQHVYLWALYPFLYFAMLWGDLSFIVRGRIGGRQVARPSLGRTAVLLVEKCAGLAVLVSVAVWQQGVRAVLVVGVIAALVHGLVSAVMFQIEHVVEGTVFPEPDATGRISSDWMRCQLVGAADVAPNSRVVTWFVGGLNLHIEHHLFPRVAAVRLPELAPVVRNVARQYGISVIEFPTMRSAVASHQRRLQALGVRPA